ncbi:MAG: chitobiase/beta-hexosaminidase C-terminal domain-containing protein [Bacteroidales bacterium]|nr:chitobiase/beta-hexosaminidase C-terminal domain-containing protein [Bacteroidales bacterium]
MKHTFSILLLAFCTTAFCQQQHNLGLIPTPQRVEMSDGHYTGKKDYWSYSKKVKVSSLPVERNADNAYQIIVEKKKITVLYITASGWNNAYHTLKQLEQLFDTLPCMTITDWPAYRCRLWMDDISRGPVIHNKFSLKQQNILNAIKFNAYTYYTEHTLYQSEYPDLAPAYADNSEYPHLGAHQLINLQLFAHAEKTLRIPFYQNLMDSKANFNPDNPDTYSFLRKRIAEAIRQNPESSYFILNCDETEQLGSGRAKKLVDEKGADQVYVDHLNRCCEIIKEEFHKREKERQLRPVMWGDIVAKNPAMMKQLPDDMVYIMWAYDPLDSYDELIKPFREQGNPFWVAPSTSHHSVMTPNPHRYMKNIANLARDGYLNGAEGFMITCWDDNGEALFDNCWHGLFWSAEMAWNPIKTNDPEEFRQREEQFNRNFERLFYKSDKPDTHPNTQALYHFGSLESNPKTSDLYSSNSLWGGLLNINPTITNRNEAEILEVLADVENIIDSAANPHLHYAYMHMLACVSQLMLQKAIDRQLSQGSTDYECRALADVFFHDLFNLKREYLRLWDQENGEYERAIVMKRYDDLAREVLELDRHVFIQTTPSSKSSASSTTPSSFPTVYLCTLYGDKEIHYTLDGSEPTSAATLYTEPFPLERSATIRAIAYNEYGEGVETSQYLLSHLAMGAQMKLTTKYGSDFRPVYSGGGDNALIDGRLGSNTSSTDGHWQGYWGDSIDARIDFGSPREIHNVSMRFIQNTFDWVLAPKQVKIYTSNDGKEWQLLTEKEFETDPRETGFQLKHYSIDIPQPTQTTTTTRTKNLKTKTQNYQFLRVVVPSGGPLPEWHTAPGQPSWLFCDEIIVK